MPARPSRSFSRSKEATADKRTPAGFSLFTFPFALRRSRALRLALALLSGVLLACSFPDHAIPPLVFVALTPLVMALAAAGSAAEAYLLALAGSTVTWLINVPWVIGVMSYYGGLPYPLGVAIYVLLALALGNFAAIFFGLVLRGVGLGRRPAAWLLVPAAWLATEYARTYLLSGFPWNPLAVALVDLRPFVAIASWTGTYALSFLVMVPATAAAWLLMGDGSPRARRMVAASTAALLVAWFAAGTVKTSREDEEVAAESKTAVALVQPNITQEMRWSSADLSEIFNKMVRLTDQAVRTGAPVIVWPESSIPLPFASTEAYRDWVESVSRDAHADIILGSVAEDASDSGKVWNSAYLVSDGVTRGRYDKIQLVPFGEYVPMRKALFFAEKLVHEVGTFQFGTNERPLPGKFEYGMAICYEIVYPQIPSTRVRNGADVLVTITNDAWFDRSMAPRQHLNHARLRAVESDRWLLRAATTGISAIVDPTGRIVTELPVHREGIVTGSFAPRHSVTPYVRFGDWFAIVTCVALAAALAAALIQRLRMRAQGPARGQR